MIPELLPSERRYARAFYATSALVLMGLLIGCGEENPPLPRTVCTQVTGTYSCGRGGICDVCGNWQIGCPKPLDLKSMPNGALICRLGDAS